tara:strand:- start:75674 stop:76762 length:1089 start_codon:yes stop_codon:yes gene_type:complete
MAKKKVASKDLELSKDRGEAFIQILDIVNGEFGAGTLTTGKDNQRIECDVIPTGALAIDLAIEAGGVPRGKITEIYGPYSSGKTTLALSVAAQAQKAGGKVAFIDAEHALDPKWAGTIGVNMDDLVISQPDYGEQALTILEKLTRSGAFDLIIIDSVPALVPKAEIEGQVGDHHVGAQARMMSQALRMLVGAVSRSRTAIIFINQIREKIGVMFGSPETTPGGRALRFYSAVRLDVRKIGVIKDGTTPIANQCKVTVKKNKIGRPFRVAEFKIGYDCGVDSLASLVDVGVNLGVIRKAGGNHYFTGAGAKEETKLGSSEATALTFLNENSAIFDEIEMTVHQKIMGTEDADTEEDGFDQEED